MHPIEKCLDGGGHPLALLVPRVPAVAKEIIDAAGRQMKKLLGRARMVFNRDDPFQSLAFKIVYQRLQRILPERKAWRANVGIRSASMTSSLEIARESAPMASL